MDENEWEVFDGFHKSWTPPSLTINRVGNLSFTRSAMKQISMPAHVILAYNRSQQTIRVQPATEEGPHTLPVRQVTGGYIVAGVAFTKRYDIDTSVARRYGVSVQDGMLYIDLKSGERVTKANIRR